MKRNGSMLDPSMSELKARINNRYLLVNVTAQLAREISRKAEDGEETLDNKPVTIALHEIADGEAVVIYDESAHAEQKPEAYTAESASEAAVEAKPAEADGEQQ